MSSVQSAFAQRKTNTLVALATSPAVYSLAGISAAFPAATGAVSAVGSVLVVGTAANIVALLGAAGSAPAVAPVQYQSVMDIGKNIFIEANTSDAFVKLREVSYETTPGIYTNAYVVVESNVLAAPVKVARV